MKTTTKSNNKYLRLNRPTDEGMRHILENIVVNEMQMEKDAEYVDDEERHRAKNEILYAFGRKK